MLTFLRKRTALAFLGCALSLGVLAAGLSGARRLPQAPAARARRLDAATATLAPQAGKLIPLWLLTEEDSRTPEFLRASRAYPRDAIPDHEASLRARVTAGRKVSMHIFESVLNL